MSESENPLNPHDEVAYQAYLRTFPQPCDHDVPLLPVDDDQYTQVRCSACGKYFFVADQPSLRAELEAALEARLSGGTPTP